MKRNDLKVIKVVKGKKVEKGCVLVGGGCGGGVCTWLVVVAVVVKVVKGKKVVKGVVCT